MKFKAIRNTKNIAIIGLIVLALAGTGAGVAYKTHAFALGGSDPQEVNDKEAADDANDKTANANEDQGKDGETNDSPNQ